jgi:hypothetical protein
VHDLLFIFCHDTEPDLRSNDSAIFEVWPQDGHRNEYLDIAAALRPMLTETALQKIA